MNMLPTAKYRKVACKQVAGETMTDVTQGRGLKRIRGQGRNIPHGPQCIFRLQGCLIRIS